MTKSNKLLSGRFLWKSIKRYLILHLKKIDKLKNNIFRLADLQHNLNPSFRDFLSILILGFKMLITDLRLLISSEIYTHSCINFKRLFLQLKLEKYVILTSILTILFLTNFNSCLNSTMNPFF